MPTFKVQGQVDDTVGSLLSLPEEETKFLQINFISDAETQAARLQQVIPGRRVDIVRPLQDMLHYSNPLIRSFKYAFENAPSPIFNVLTRTPGS